jgi:multidrug efflux pump subunit AcrB
VNDVARFYVRSAQGHMVPLNTLTTTRMTTGPDAVSRFNV